MAFKLDNIRQKETAAKNPGGSLESLLKKEIVLFGERFGAKKRQAFYEELGVLLNAGITVKDALSLVVESMKKKSDKEMLRKILNEVIAGQPFSEALHQSGPFSEYEYYSLKIGEETGTVALVCTELALFYARKNEQKRIVVAALTYPAIVLSTAVCVVIFMLSYVVPMFEDIFKQNNMELPVLTRIIVSLSAMTKTYGIYGFILLFFVPVGYSALERNLAFRRQVHYSLLRIPIFGPFITKVYLARFTQALALLTSSKIPMLNCIQLVRKMIGFIPLEEALDNVEKSLLAGKTLSNSLARNKLFDNRIISLVKVAEETNQTEYVIRQLNEQYNQEVVQQSKIMVTLLEPLLILFVGAIVAVLLIALYLPMFQLSSAIG